MKRFIPLSMMMMLVACAPQTGSGEGLALHDIALLGPEGVVYSYAYGDPGVFRVAEQTYKARAPKAEEIREDNFMQINDAMMIENNALRETRAYLRRGAPDVRAPMQVRRSRLSSDVLVRTNAPVEAVLYYDGQRWFNLLDKSPGRFDNRVVPKERLNALRNMGNMTNAEAHAIAKYIEWLDEPIAIAVLPSDSLELGKVEGVDDYRKTVLYLQRNLPEDVMPFTEAPQTSTWELLAEGNQAVGREGMSFALARSADALLRNWNEVYGSRLTVPSVPVVNFQQASVVTIFLGQKTTGGYGIEVDDVLIEDGEMYINVTTIEPKPGDFTTQAFTSPWVMVQVREANLPLVWVRDSATGSLLGVARPN